MILFSSSKPGTLDTLLRAAEWEQAFFSNHSLWPFQT